MEFIDLLLILVCIAVGVLNIILFFKVWGMTDNVKELKKIICNNNLSRKDIWLFVINEIHTDEEVHRVLSENFLREGVELYESYFTDGTGGDYTLKYSSMRKFYEKMYELRPNMTPSKWLSLLCFNDFKTEIEKTK